jgi:hypothetical protein
MNALLSPMKRVPGYTIPMHLWLLCTLQSKCEHWMQARVTMDQFRRLALRTG